MPAGGQKHASEVKVWKLPPEEWLKDDKLAMLKGWSRDGYTLKEVAFMMGLSTSGLAKWRKQYPQIDEALKVGITETNYMVESALLKLALGYQTEEVRVTTTVRHGKTVEQITEHLTREQPPSIQAIQTWLYNKSKDKWKNMNSSRNFLEDIDEDTSISITIERPSKNEMDDGVRRPVDEDAEDSEWIQALNKEVRVRGLSEDEKKQKRDSQKKAAREAEETSEAQRNKRKRETVIDFEDDSEEYSDEDWDAFLSQLEE